MILIYLKSRNKKSKLKQNKQITKSKKANKQKTKKKTKVEQKQDRIPGLSNVS